MCELVIYQSLAHHIMCHITSPAEMPLWAPTECLDKKFRGMKIFPNSSFFLIWIQLKGIMKEILINEDIQHTI